MSLLIATDEAGYGPKLGPLVIVATAWRIPAATNFDSAFEPLGAPLHDPRCDAVLIDDSKRVFKRHQKLAAGQASLLEVVCRAASNWASLPDPLTDFSQWFKSVVATDRDAALKAPWFADFADLVTSETSVVDRQLNAKLIDHWSATGLELRGIQAQFLTAATFNQLVDEGQNKADILTASTCRLAFEMLSKLGYYEPSISVFSDRHGGRAFYGAALQQVSAGSNLRVVRESKTVSEYQLSHATAKRTQSLIDWSFTVGGDSFAPVALSSMIAKWLRERAMHSFNRYFLQRMPGGGELRPTAGYPLDADRFLQAIELAGLRKTIADQVLIRKR